MPIAQVEPLVTTAEIQSGFSKPIQPITTRAGYRTALVAVVVSLILLQLVYVALVFAVGAGVAYYVYRLPAIFFAIPHLNATTGALALSPPIAGAIAFFFLLKPLLAKQAERPYPVELTPSEQPELFEFVNTLCRKLGSPAPARIWVDLQVNASASLGSSWMGIFKDKPELTIGLPLASGLTLTQFTGVLAHEFGHFSQKAGLRSQFLIRTIQHWFSRVAFERDQWDEKLEVWHESAGNYGQIIVGVARLAVWISRAVLRGLLYVASLVSSGFSRQMEYDADLYEAAIVGVATAEETLFELRNLAVAGSHTWGEIAESWKAKRLVANYPDMLQFVRASLTGDSLAALRQAELSEESGRHSTHPSTIDRLANFRRNSAPGIFDLPGGATRLFRDFRELSQHVTEHHYRLSLGGDLDGATLLGSDEIAAYFGREQDYADAFRQIFGVAPQAAEWLELPETPGETVEASSGEWEDSAAREALGLYLTRESALALLSGRASIDTASFRISSNDLSTVKEEVAQARDSFDQSARHLMRLAGAAANRISEGVSKAVQSGLSGPDWEGPVVWRAFFALSGERGALLELRTALTRWQALNNNKNAMPAAECANALDAEISRAARIAREIAARLENVDPQMSIHGRMGSLAKVLTSPAEDPLENAAACLNLSGAVRARLLGRLCWLALATEKR